MFVSGGAADVPAVFLVDAGLNLNAKAFDNLAEAEKRTGFLQNAAFWCEVYPSLVNEKQIDFLSSILLDQFDRLRQHG